MTGHHRGRDSVGRDMERRRKATRRPGGRAVWGIDLGTNAASESAVAAYWPEDVAGWRWWRAFPADPRAFEGARADATGSGGAMWTCAGTRGVDPVAGERAVNVSRALLRGGAGAGSAGRRPSPPTVGGRPSYGTRWRSPAIPPAAFEARGHGLQGRGRGREAVPALVPGGPRDSPSGFATSSGAR